MHELLRRSNHPRVIPASIVTRPLDRAPTPRIALINPNLEHPLHYIPKRSARSSLCRRCMIVHPRILEDLPASTGL